MKLSKTMGYAIIATLELAGRPIGRPISSSQLAEPSNLPERFLLHILRGLVTHGVLTSTRGVGGGYRLSRDPHEISLLDIIEAVEGPLKIELPFNEGPVIRDAKLTNALDEVAEELRQRLAKIKLGDLIAAGKRISAKPRKRAGI